jgi:hypothetical protein
LNAKKKNDSPLLEFIGLCVAWAKAEPAIFGSGANYLKQGKLRLASH